jgi:hypothetical protein
MNAPALSESFVVSRRFDGCQVGWIAPRERAAMGGNKVPA